MVWLASGLAAVGAGTVAVVSTALSPGAPTQDSAAQVALGDSIFHGKSAQGLCYTCHQANGKGMKGIAPDLTDAKWLHGDGSVESIMATVEKGVAKPKESPLPMMPWGGGRKLTPAELRAVALYVKSLGPK
jgi:mono/diheme cytochrome c family protein